MLRKVVLVAVVLFSCLPVAALASDVVDKGTVEISGATSLVVNKQTLSSKDSDGNAVGTDVDMTSTTVGLTVAYYVTPRLAVGGTINHQKLTLSSAEDKSEISGGYFGGLLKYRIPLSGRADFVLTGAGGATQSKIDPTEGGTDASGFFFLGGGAVSLMINQFSTFDVGLSYQGSRFSGSDSGEGRLDASGLVVGIGFSLYFNNR